MKTYLLIALFTISLWFPLAAQASECGENETGIIKIAEALAQGQIPDTPLLLDATTFFHLQPEIRQKLGDKIRLCPQIPLKDGKPIFKQKMDFADIWDAMELAIAANDWDTVKLISSATTVKPLPADALFSLIIYPLFDEKTMKKLAEIVGIPLKNSQKGWRFFLLDVYSALGGSAEKPETIYWAQNEKQLSKARSIAEARKDNTKFALFSGIQAEQAEESLRICGVTTAPADNYINKR